jgi:hypothetical protein
MNSTVSRLPEAFKPVRELSICSNAFVDVGVPIAFKGSPILLLASGSVPSIWLSAPLQPGSEEWGFVVSESRSHNPALQVVSDTATGSVTIRAGHSVVVEAKMTAADAATVVRLDLRPLGLAVTGDADGLRVGTTTLRQNRFERVGTGIALG